MKSWLWVCSGFLYFGRQCAFPSFYNVKLFFFFFFFNVHWRQNAQHFLCQVAFEKPFQALVLFRVFLISVPVSVLPKIIAMSSNVYGLRCLTSNFQPRCLSGCLDNDSDNSHSLWLHYTHPVFCVFGQCTSTLAQFLWFLIIAPMLHVYY